MAWGAAPRRFCLVWICDKNAFFWFGFVAGSGVFALDLLQDLSIFALDLLQGVCCVLCDLL